MNISDMLNKPPRFTPIKALMGNLPHELEVSRDDFKDERQESNFIQQEPQYQPPSEYQGQNFVYQNGFSSNFTNYHQNPQSYYESQPIPSYSYQQPLNYQDQYVSQPCDASINYSNNIANQRISTQNASQGQHQINQLPKLAIPPKNEEEISEFGKTTCNSASSSDSGRSAPYTLHDDLSIFKVVAAYYGFGFHGKIPWSFWQTYKRATGSTRSNSSLYHHWNGAMKKKYDAFISNGRLSDCILWLETAVMAEQSSNVCLNSQLSNAGSIHGSPDIQQHTGTPLFHNRSEPPISLVAVDKPSIAQMQPMTLVRTPSVANEPFPFTH